MKTKIIFVTGGVVSSLGKGITSASLAALLQMRGYKVCMRKLDPYLNVDPGTMSPYQHGEVFVTEDGAETDLDLGHYERFTGINAKKSDNLTSGQVYEKLIAKERKGAFLGVTVQVIPHVTNLIKEFITNEIEDLDFLICEVGGTVGDIEALPYFEAIRQLGQRGGYSCAYIHLTLIPYLPSVKELKTKPTQHSVKELLSIGIQPDIIVCRCDREVPEKDKNKIALLCNVDKERVIPGVDQDSIYKVPLEYHKEGLDNQILKIFNLENKDFDKSNWERLMAISDQPDYIISLDIIGKYNQLEDSYKSLLEAFYHAGLAHKARVKINWISAEDLEKGDPEEILKNSQAIMVPGGFGSRGKEGKIKAITFAREKKIPFFGICLGMQLAAIEFARSILGIKDADSAEFSDSCTDIINLASNWIKEGSYEVRNGKDPIGGTMRLGSYPCHLKEASKAQAIYAGKNLIAERHRHRYELNIRQLEAFEKAGLIASGYSEDRQLIEILELKDHPWFIGVQFHPEFKSRLLEPHPLFMSFIEAILSR
jgi:CTP synthase